MAARELRYTWFNKIMREYGYEILVTAHHADDNLETFLINLSRGTGIEGLIGIPEKTDTIARPLLAFSRAQITAYAQAENIEWREDNSNVETKYLRNNIRHKIVPLLKELNPDFLNKFGETQHFLSQTASIADDRLKNIKSTLFLMDIGSSNDTGFSTDYGYSSETGLSSDSGSSSKTGFSTDSGRVVRIPIAKLLALSPLQGYLYGLFGEYGFTEWNDVENLLHAMSGKEVRSKTHRLIKDRDYLLLTEIPTAASTMPLESDALPSALNTLPSIPNTLDSKRNTPPWPSAGMDKTKEFSIEEGQRNVKTPLKIKISEVDVIGETGAHILYVSQKALKYPLTLRKWENGDYFYPLGMQGKKKLSKFFKDEKVDVLAKERQWLLCSKDAVVWVIGRRADERFKVLDNTQNILKFELET